MLTWMPYAVAIGLLFTGAASLLHSLPAVRRRPRRWLWAAALGATVALPWVLTLAPSTPYAGGGDAGPTTAVGTPTVVAAAAGAGAGAPEAAWLVAADRGLRWGWLLATTGLVTLLAVSGLRLRRRLARWPRRRIDGTWVRVGSVPGPAVVGVRRPEIVVPSWVLDLPEADRRLILDHERAHLSAGDPLLMCAAWLLAAATPWNAALWVQLRRLRGAMEEDCDRRVIRNRPWSDARRYGELLVDVGARVGPGASLAPAAFAEGGSHLERRLRTMFELYPPLSRIRTILAAAGALGLAAAVFFLPGPDRAALLGPDEVDAVDEAEVTFTPFTRAPELLNPLEVRRALEAEYPPLLRDAGIGGTVEVWVYVDAEGAPTDTRIDESSGHQALDRAALEVVSIMRFRPAANRDESVAAWVSMPLRFTDGDGDGAAEATRPDRVEIPPPAEPSDDDLAARPIFTPYSVAPDLTNRGEVMQALEAAYPAALRAERIGGTARVWFFIDENGRVGDTRIESSSGHPEIDEAALEVASIMEFTPALNRDQPVPVWVAFPITFQVR